MAKIQAQAGKSLADVYQVQGSIAGVEDLLSKDVNLVHEMGGTILSERLVGRVFVLEPAAVAQNVSFSIGVTIANVPARILNVQVITDVAARILHAQVCIAGQGTTNNDLPVWMWDSVLDTEGPVRIILDGTLATLNILRPLVTTQTPTLTIGIAEGQPAQSPLSMSLRGTTEGFGAGTVTITGLVYAAFPDIAGGESRGLPFPSW